MNLKESFRYQNFLDGLMRSASNSIQTPSHALKVTKSHHCNKANSDAEDFDEVVEVDDFFENDEVIRFMAWLIEERKKLTEAIDAAKASVDFDIDAAVETNKFRQILNSSIRNMLRNVPGKKIEQGKGYKFNAEGNQVPYFYDVEVTSKEAYNKSDAKKLMRLVIEEADKISTEIDSATINTVVNYEPRFDVNESFEDVMTDFVQN